jgi:hypothetical protein
MIRNIFFYYFKDRASEEDKRHFKTIYDEGDPRELAKDGAIEAFYDYDGEISSGDVITISDGKTDIGDFKITLRLNPEIYCDEVKKEGR